jgi:molecular chaperone GrpE
MPDEQSTNEAEPDRATMTRALRDLEAAQARVERNAERVYEETRSKLIAELLPVLDNLDRTIQASGRDPALVEGVRLVRSQLEGVLAKYGLERIDARGRRFDPNIHDAISVSPVRDPKLHAMVLEQVEPGYRFGSRLLRPAKVVVGQSIM